jgi:hypothetical protein
MHLSLQSVQRTFHAQGPVRHTQHSIRTLHLRIASFGFGSKWRDQCTFHYRSPHNILEKGGKLTLSSRRPHLGISKDTSPQYVGSIWVTGEVAHECYVVILGKGTLVALLKNIIPCNAVVTQAPHQVSVQSLDFRLLCAIQSSRARALQLAPKLDPLQLRLSSEVSIEVSLQV